MALTAQQIQTQIDALVVALGSPSLSTRFADGRMVTFRSVDEIRSALAELNNQMDIASGGASRVGFAQHKRGDGPSGPTPWTDKDW